MAAKKKQKEETLDLTTTPNIYYQKFFDKFKEIDSLQVSQWKIYHIIGYFCKRYRNHFGVDYAFKFNATPSKSYEVFQVKKLSGMLSADPTTIKLYIDWLFDTKIIPQSKRVLAIGFIATANYVNEYQLSIQKQAKISRSTILPDNIVDVVTKMNLSNVSTYGDLAFLKAALTETEEAQLNLLLGELSRVGFDYTLLDAIK